MFRKDEPKKNVAGTVAIGAAITAVAGYIAGVLTAPKSGKETREDIKVASTKAKDTAVEKAEEAKEAGLRVASDVKAKAEEVAGDVKAKAEEIYGDASDKAVELKGRTEQAIDGAKKGFNKKPKANKK